MTWSLDLRVFLREVESAGVAALVARQRLEDEYLVGGWRPAEVLRDVADKWQHLADLLDAYRWTVEEYAVVKRSEARFAEYRDGGRP